MSFRKRHRGSLSDRSVNSEPEQRGVISPEVADLIMEHVRLHSKNESNGSAGPLACPFFAKDPRRYGKVKGHSCQEGFKDIAALKDHIKRTHSSKYGCPICGIRFHCRNKQIDDELQKHRSGDCFKRLHPPMALFRPSDHEPERMSPDQDARVLSINFNAKKYNDIRGNVEEQYWTLCGKIWPDLERDSFSMWSGSSVSLHSLKAVLTLLSQSSPDRPDNSSSRLEDGAPEEQHQAQGNKSSDDVPKTPMTTPVPSPSVSRDHRPTKEGEREIFSLYAVSQPPASNPASVEPAIPTRDSGFYTQSGGGDGEVTLVDDNESTHPTEFEDNYSLTMESKEAAGSSKRQRHDGLGRADASFPTHGDESPLLTSPSVQDCNTMGIGGAVDSSTGNYTESDLEMGGSFDADASEWDPDPVNNR